MTDFDIRPASEADIAERVAARLTGLSFLVYRDPPGRQQIVFLRAGTGNATIGRREDSDVALAWDPGASRVHAQLEPVGGEWTIIDDGLSRNGTFVNGQRLSGRQRLHDRDLIIIGLTQLLYRSPPDLAGSTAVSRHDRPTVHLTETQRRVLTALCRPCLNSQVLASPATNRQIANEIFLSVDAVKTHLRALFTKFDVGDLPHNQKRIKLVSQAIHNGAVTPQ